MSDTQVAPPDDESRDRPLPTAADDPEATMAPDMAPTADAFDAMATVDTSGTEAVDRPGEDAAAADDDEDEPSAAPAGWLSRLPGQPRQWALGGMVAGGILVGALASGAVAWKMIGSRDAEAAARTVRMDAQSARLAEQAEKIEVLTRALSERPIPEPDTATGPGTEPQPAPAAAAAVPPTATASPAAVAAASAPAGGPAGAVPGAAVPAGAVPAAAAPPAAAPAPAAKVATSTTPAPAPAPTRAAEPPARPLPVATGSAAPASAGRAEPQAIGPAGVSPSLAGSGICDVPGGSDAATRMRQCIDWFAGRDKASGRPAP